MVKILLLQRKESVPHSLVRGRSGCVLLNLLRVLYVCAQNVLLLAQIVGVWWVLGLLAVQDTLNAENFSLD